MSLQQQLKIQDLEARLAKVESERRALRRSYLDCANGLEAVQMRLDVLIGERLVKELPPIYLPFPTCLRELGYRPLPRVKQEDTAP